VKRALTVPKPTTPCAEALSGTVTSTDSTPGAHSLICAGQSDIRRPLPMGIDVTFALQVHGGSLV